jgi:hypothetical protein
MKIIITENQLEKLTSKLKNIFEDRMQPFIKLMRGEREYVDEEYNTYLVYVYYVDIETDWEDDEFIFLAIPVDDDHTSFKLEYNKFNLRDVYSLFGKNKFEELLKDWFERNYGLKISSVYSY